MSGAASAWLSYSLALHSLHKEDAKGLAQHALEKGMSASPAPQVRQHQVLPRNHMPSYRDVCPALSMFMFEHQLPK